VNVNLSQVNESIMAPLHTVDAQVEFIDEQYLSLAAVALGSVENAPLQEQPAENVLHEELAGFEICLQASVQLLAKVAQSLIAVACCGASSSIEATIDDKVTNSSTRRMMIGSFFNLCHVEIRPIKSQPRLPPTFTEDVVPVWSE
jgi:hypothetical protein